jgi:class 3 adenylate cyclase
MPLSLDAQLAAVQSAVDKFADGDFSGAIPVERRDESGALAFTLNRLAKFYGTIAVLSNKKFARLVQNGKTPPINQHKKAAVLFCNIRSFSTLAQNLRPKEKQHVLNGFFEKVSLCAQITGGYLDKIIGDKAMFHWGILNEGGIRDNALSAVRAALMMRAYLSNWNEKRIAAGEFPVPFSFGIDAGPASLSSFSIGGVQEYSLTGPAVNNAYHCMLQTKALRTETVLTETMRNLVVKYIVASEIAPAAPATGRKTNTRLFTLINMREKTATERLLKDLARIADIDLASVVTFVGPRGPKTLSELRAALHFTIPAE